MARKIVLHTDENYFNELVFDVQFNAWWTLRIVDQHLWFMRTLKELGDIYGE